MRLRTLVFLIAVVIGVAGLDVRGQKAADLASPGINWREAKPAVVTLYSRMGHKVPEGYGRSAFSFKHAVRSDADWSKKARNKFELAYGGISFDGNSDYFQVTMVVGDLSRIRDLGKMEWSEVTDVPYMPAPLEPSKGQTIPDPGRKSEGPELREVVHVVLGHVYVVHSKDRDTDIYTAFRVDDLKPSDNVTISWKRVPSPEQIVDQ